jgi:polyisoprenyl-teichoic acid--peptidoglycan teichoic acid transferase
MRQQISAALILIIMLALVGCANSQRSGGSSSASPPDLWLFNENGKPTATPFLPLTDTPQFRQPLPHSPTPAPTLVPPSPAAATATPTPTLQPTQDWSKIEWPPPFGGTPGPTQVTPIPTPFPFLETEGVRTILLLGSDRRSSTSFRTDSIVIAAIRPRERTVTLISVPRDLFVYIPGWTMQRINTAYQYGERTGYPGGGPGLLNDTILYNLGIKINGVAMVNFDGFRRIVDTLGGIEVPVVCPYTDWRIIDPEEDEQDEDNWSLYTIGPGLIKMDGETALWYARARSKSSDFDRGRRQQEILRAIFNRSMKIDAIRRIPQLYTQLRDSVETDISLETLIDLSPLAFQLSAPRIRSVFINREVVTSWRTPGGASVLLPDGPALQVRLKEALGPFSNEQSTRLDQIVDITNASGNPGWDVLAAERLHYAGYDTHLSNPQPQQEESSLIVRDLASHPQQTADLLKVLGLSPDRYEQDFSSSGAYDYRLVLGADYNPCSNPSQNR